MTNRIYCTYFDRAYAPRAQLLVSSLREVGESGPIVAVCFDDEAVAAAHSWGDPGVVTVEVGELERRFPQLRQVRPQRSRAEYLFTSTPFVVLYAMTLSAPSDWVVYLDADMWFTQNPQPLFDELGSAAVGLVSHDYLPSHRRLEQFGKYNVGWVSMRNTTVGEQAAHWWAQQCQQWCGDYVEGTRFADQGYLTELPARFPSVAVITHPGANLGPWNVNSRRIGTDDRGRLTADEQPVVFFHFHGVRRVGSRYVIAHFPFGTRPCKLLREQLYRPYLNALTAATRGRNHPPALRGRGWRGRLSRTRRHLLYLVDILRGDSYPVEDPRL